MTVSAGARWSIMVISLIVTSSSFLFINGVAFLIPALEAERGTPLTEASLLASMPSWGMVVTLVGWGYVLDRVGERIVLTAGSALTAVAAYAAASVHSLVWVGVFLFLGGMAAASCNSAGGRLVSGWFPPEQRGLAMGIRQTAQPLGIAVGALAIPELAEHSPHAGLMFPAVACTLAALLSLIGVVDSPRKPVSDGHRPGTGQPLSRVVGAVANSRGVRADDDAADGDRHLHAGLADQKRRLVDCVGGRGDDGLAATGRAGPNLGRALVRSDRLADAARRGHRCRRRVDPVPAGLRR